MGDQVHNAHSCFCSKRSQMHKDCRCIIERFCNFVSNGNCIRNGNDLYSNGWIHFLWSGWKNATACDLLSFSPFTLSFSPLRSFSLLTLRSSLRSGAVCCVERNVTAIVEQQKARDNGEIATLFALPYKWIHPLLCNSFPLWIQLPLLTKLQNLSIIDSIRRLHSTILNRFSRVAELNIMTRSTKTAT